NFRHASGAATACPPMDRAATGERMTSKGCDAMNNGDDRYVTANSKTGLWIGACLVVLLVCALLVELTFHRVTTFDVCVKCGCYRINTRISVFGIRRIQSRIVDNECSRWIHTNISDSDVHLWIPTRAYEERDF